MFCSRLKVPVETFSALFRARYVRPTFSTFLNVLLPLHSLSLLGFLRRILLSSYGQVSIIHTQGHTLHQRTHLARPTHVEVPPVVPPTSGCPRTSKFRPPSRTPRRSAPPPGGRPRLRAGPALSITAGSSPHPSSVPTVHFAPPPLLPVREAEPCDDRWRNRLSLLLLSLLLLLLILLLLLVLLRRWRWRWRWWYRQSWRSGPIYRTRTVRVREVAAGALLLPPSKTTRSLRRTFPLKT